MIGRDTLVCCHGFLILNQFAMGYLYFLRTRIIVRIFHFGPDGARSSVPLLLEKKVGAIHIHIICRRKGDEVQYIGLARLITS